MTDRFESFEQFWPFYLGEHSLAQTRRWHFWGSASLLPLLLLAVLASPWWLALYPVVAYGAAWYSHFAFEHNQPATFKFPLWSLRADIKLFWLTLTRQLDKELQRLADD